jgi:hypothetical protein
MMRLRRLLFSFYSDRNLHFDGSSNPVHLRGALAASESAMKSRRFAKAQAGFVLLVLGNKLVISPPSRH